uniref:Cyclic nucleotide-binding domain protein n=1 Tax=Rhizobium rhizogenes TaxID=359 RepID=A0A7S4ZVD6_RHIRH|nr:Crp/Fnr family transcriptional regulator [Rhizobium rhizogenes]QCL10588.1 cyclic nucleotide-binding domain protein [Rhizobium rhizogenes]
MPRLPQKPECPQQQSPGVDEAPQRTAYVEEAGSAGISRDEWQSNSLLNWLPADVRNRCASRELGAGEHLFRQGDETFSIFEVESGRIRLIRHTIDSHLVILHTARKGELFAEAALFAHTYHCDAVAAAASRIRIYPKAALLAAFRRDPITSERFMAVLANQIHRLRARLEERNIRSARDRILHHLDLNVDVGTRALRLEGSLMDLAAELGMTHEVLYRTLADLEKDGSVGRSPGYITLNA